MSFSRSFLPVLVLLLGSSAGCELFTTIDRRKIPDGISPPTGGNGGMHTGGAGGMTTGGTGGMSTGGTGGMMTGGTGGMMTGGTGGTMTGGTGGMMTGGTGGATTTTTTTTTGSGGAGGTTTTTTTSSTTTTTTTTTSGTGGAGGGTPECTNPTQCPTPANECLAAQCVAGTCTTAFVAANTPSKDQAIGDCHIKECDGNGNLVDEVDDTDVPNDGNACTNDSCSNGAQVFANKAAGAACGTGLICDGAGVCVGCIDPSDCGADTPCRTFTCTAGVCGHVDKPLGYEVSNPTPGDCRNNQCDGNGNVTIGAVLDSDTPVDEKQCTADVCSNGAPSNPSLPAGSPCSESGGTQCDGAGKCVACLQASDCGASTPCKTWSCVAGQCVAAIAPPGALAANPSAGDCRNDRCDANGNVLVGAVDDTDRPVDGKQCTSDVCSNGTPSNPALAANTPCNQNGGTRCDAIGNCVECVVDAECGANTPCRTFSCVAGHCTQANASLGTVVNPFPLGNCRTDQCDGAGNVVTNVVDDADKPSDDGNQCTLDTCVAGVPGHPPAPLGTSCVQNGGSTCDGNGACVTCTADSQCPIGNACQVAKCLTGTCGFIAAPAGPLPAAAQTAGDCQERVCDGATQAPVSVADDDDLPPDDGFECTVSACAAGVGSHQPKTPGTACSEDGGVMCDSAGLCVSCIAAGDCAAGLNECQIPLCVGGTCDWDPVADSTVTVSQVSGDCRQQQCDGAGSFKSKTDDTDLPDDGLDCTTDTCDAGSPLFTAAAPGTPCSQGSGFECDAAGICRDYPLVLSIEPGDGTSDWAWREVAVHFDQPMDPQTLFVQDTAGPCTGSVQVSLDDFASCIGFWDVAPSMYDDDSSAAFWPRPGLLVNRTYKVRVTTAVESALGHAMLADYESPNGFTTLAPNTCDWSVVITKVYGGGGTPGATYKHDFVELHNRGTEAVDLSELSLQYSAPTSYQWTQDPVTFPFGTMLEPGGYYLVQLATGGPSGAPLPTAPDLVSNGINLSAIAGKIALVWGTWQQPNDACPDPRDVSDFVSYGVTNCSEGSYYGDTSAPALDAAKVLVRNDPLACADVDSNDRDFSAVAATNPTLRNTATAPNVCACGALNESGAPGEADYCATQFPLGITMPYWSDSEPIYGRIYEQGVTEAAGASANIVAQVGYGDIDSNPQYDWGWLWTNATFNVQSGNDDEYQATITPYWDDFGSYRYVYRFSMDGGLTWTYCDNAQGDMGAGSNAGLSFDVADTAPFELTD